MSDAPSYDPSSTSMLQQELDHMTDDSYNSEDYDATSDSESSSEGDQQQQSQDE